VHEHVVVDVDGFGVIRFDQAPLANSFRIYAQQWLFVIGEWLCVIDSGGLNNITVIAEAR